MKNFTAGRWSGDAQLLWTGGKTGASLELDLTAPSAAAAFTGARSLRPPMLSKCASSR